MEQLEDVSAKVAPNCQVQNVSEQNLGILSKRFKVDENEQGSSIEDEKQSKDPHNTEEVFEIDQKGES